ncbi:MAG: ABC transporter permease [Myxococcaceae bacterium]|nr:ABC transporter permease [Myxococcaceae bacterium]
MRAFLDNLRLAFGTFIANPLRTLLTLLGIVIGVATVIAMMSLIEGLRLKVNRDLSQLGANTFQVTKWPVGFGRVNWNKYAKRPNFTLADRDDVMKHATLVRTVSAEDAHGGQKVSTSDRETRPTVIIWGVTPEWTETSGVEVQSGRFFSQAEELEGRAVAVLGQDVVDVLFPGTDPIGQQVRVRNRPYTVIGVLQRRGSFLGIASMDNLVMLPMHAFHAAFGQNRSVDLNVQAIDAASVKQAQEEVTQIFRRRRGLSPFDENNFEVHTNDSMTRMFNSLSQVISAASFGVCLLSLVVGGIGILNIMLVSVTERTREIGIRRALGARRRRILMQFATEAVALSLLGGVLGIAIGYFVAFLARWVLDFPAVVPVWSVVLSVVMSSVVGLAFGIYPAARAARLDPVEAMRSE